MYKGKMGTCISWLSGQSGVQKSEGRGRGECVCVCSDAI